MIRKIIIILILSCSGIFSFGQDRTFGRQDSLRGSVTPERIWWDLKYYHLDIAVNPKDSTIHGSVDVVYKVLESKTTLQIDLQPPLIIKKVVDESGKVLKVNSEGNAHFVELLTEQKVGDIHTIVVYYGGKPKVAIRPPWDGGISWDIDQNGNHIIHSNCQGIGASIWWPCKDHMYDEPDSVLISVNVPDNLMDVSNGRLRKVEDLKDGTKTYHWFVSNPISNYVININIADYSHFSEVYKGEKGDLDMDYYVFPYNVEKAKSQFKDAPRMMEAFEYWFGPYPFYEDGYKLVEVPSTGMEHQSSITYGNGYKNGYRGRDGSGTGWGFKFDFIIIHESGHEWFANNITYKDVADMWIHESFTNYSESLFLEYHFGMDAGREYVRGTRRLIRNDRTIIGNYGVNSSGSGDMYVKGGNLLNMLRQIINDDEKWREILRGLNKTFYHKTVTTGEIENFISEATGINLEPFFDQYLRDIRIPVLEYYHRDKQVYYRWSNCRDNFSIPIEIHYAGQSYNLNPTRNWGTLPIDEEGILSVNPNYYIATFNIK